MKRITLILGVVALMVALTAPAMAKDNDGPKGGGKKANNKPHDNGGRHNGGGISHRGGDKDFEVDLVKDVDVDVDRNIDRDIDVDFVGDFDPGLALISDV